MSQPDSNEPTEPKGETATPETATASATPEAVPTLDFSAEIEAAKAEARAAQDRYLRSVADLENFRRRAVREKEETQKTAGIKLVEDIIPVLDNLSLALTAAKQPNADLKNLIAGLDMVLQQAKSALGNHGLKEIHPIGQPFNPHEHEAISHQPSQDIKPEHVTNVVRTGYSLNGRIVRPASVVISSGPAPAEAKS